MPEIRDHHERRYYAIRLGGWRLFGKMFGAGRYTVGPISVADGINLFRQVKAVHQALDKHPTWGKRLTKAVPHAVLKPLIPLMVEERIRRRDLVRATVTQIGVLLGAFYEANDFKYITDTLTPTPGDGGRRMTLNDGLHHLVTRCHVYTHAELRKLPLQEFLAISESERRNTEAQADVSGDELRPGESKQTLDLDDWALFESCGFGRPN